MTAIADGAAAIDYLLDNKGDVRGEIAGTFRLAARNALRWDKRKLALEALHAAGREIIGATVLRLIVPMTELNGASKPPR